MKVDKEKLLDLLLELFYEFILKECNEHPSEYSKGYREGMLKIIDAVNNYTEEE
jgi:hypothetical protein